MHDSKCGCGGGGFGHGCSTSMVVKVLLIIGGLNWGLMGLGMLMGNDANAWNVVHMIFNSVPTLEGIIYLLVGVAAVMKIFGCKCKKCMSCKDGSCDTENTEGMDNKM